MATLNDKIYQVSHAYVGKVDDEGKVTDLSPMPEPSIWYLKDEAINKSEPLPLTPIFSNTLTIKAEGNLWSSALAYLARNVQPQSYMVQLGNVVEMLGEFQHNKFHPQRIKFANGLDFRWIEGKWIERRILKKRRRKAMARKRR